MKPKPIILDISEHQQPAQINYDQLAQAIDLVIIRVQYGDLHEDLHYQTHIREFQQRGIPVHVYAWIRGYDESNMELEAEVFYQRAARFNPVFWWLDIEEQTMPDIVKGAECFRTRLKELGAKKVGAYIANHLYAQFGFGESSIRQYDALWLPTYGANNGDYQGSDPTAANQYDLHQYTSTGHLSGYSGSLDLSRLSGKRPFAYFTDKAAAPDKSATTARKVGDTVMIQGIYTSSDSLAVLKPLRTVGRITSILPNAKNPYLLDNGHLGWVNDHMIVTEPVTSTRVYTVQAGDTLSAIAHDLGLNWQTLAEMNQLTNPNLIYPRQKLHY